MEVGGRISPKIRHLLNALCSLPHTVFLEAGSWKGASFISALAGNEDRIAHAYAIDNWSQYGTPIESYSSPEKEFDQNTAEFLSRAKWQKIKQDIFAVEFLEFTPTVFYYDADHGKTEAGVRQFFPMLANPCIVCLDDWGMSHVQRGWRQACKADGIQVVCEWELPSEKPKDTDLWWEGFYVAIITKGKPCRESQPAS
jgi:hypothetical protein